METVQREICPVCKGRLPSDARAGMRCPSCGFEEAAVRLFVGPDSYRLWKKKVEKGRRAYQGELRRRCAAGRCFVLGSDSVAFLSPQQNRLYLIGADAKVQVREHVLQYSCGERHAVILRDDHTLEASGDNSNRQCEVGGLTDVTFALAGPGCTYAVQRGRVIPVGAPAHPQVKRWGRICSLACGAYHIAGLRQDGTVCLAGEMLDAEVIAAAEAWRDVAEIAAATDCTLALHKDGSVSFAGRLNDPRREAAGWTDIAAIGVDSVYAVGLTKGGEIRLAGKCRSAFLDMGRQSAGSWKDVLAIACSRSGIGAVDGQGRLLMAGNFSGDVKGREQAWQEQLPEHVLEAVTGKTERTASLSA